MLPSNDVFTADGVPLPPLIRFSIFSTSIGVTIVSYLVREAQTFKLEVVGESTGAAEQYPIGG